MLIVGNLFSLIVAYTHFNERYLILPYSSELNPAERV